jgi:hypothetical protein
MGDYYFDGDPEVDSTRRHLERVLQGRPSRRWPWVVAAFAGGAALAFWRVRSHRGAAANAAEKPPDAAPKPAPDLRHAR